MRIAMIGAGYVGLVSGACLAELGHDVVCVDSDADRIDTLLSGRLPIFEPGLEELVARNVAAQRLTFTTDLVTSVRTADVIFIAVGTPSRRGDGHADLTYVFDAARSIASVLDGFTTIVTKSTVPIGTGDEVERIIAEANPAAQFAVVSNPEFLREGAAIEDFMRPDRIVIGLNDDRARAVMEDVYRPILQAGAPVVFTDRRSAELTKYVANAFLAMKVTFINEMAELSEAVGANIEDIAHSIGLDKRIAAAFLQPGPGYGGSCFPKDTLALVKSAQQAGTSTRLVETTIAVNDARKQAMADKVIAACGGDVAGKTIAVLGLTFKPNTDDMREAPSLPIMRKLLENGAHVRAYDPEGMPAAKALFPEDSVQFSESAYEAAKDAHAAVVVTEWSAFRTLDLGRLGQAMRERVLIDLRNIYRRDEVERLGFAYTCIGRPGRISAKSET